MGKYTKIANPRTGSLVFAQMPDIGSKDSPQFMPGGDIYLYEGDAWRAKGQPRGFGLKHIMDKHGHELAPYGYTTRGDYIRFVDEILRPGSVVRVENDKTKPIVVMASIGMVSLKSRYDFESKTEIYEVLSAYKKSNLPGYAVGSWEEKGTD